MKYSYPLRFILGVVLILSMSDLFAQYPAGTPAAKNGKLKVIGTQLSSECGNAVQLKGMSTHGLQWYPSCYTAASIADLANTWNISVLRLAMYNSNAASGTGTEAGYDTDTARFNHLIDDLVDECGKRGIYAIIDWHIAAQGDPNTDIANAKTFWSRMSATHGKKKHVLYEICNEPQVGMSSIMQYANVIIPLIRANDPTGVIIIGTPSYSSQPNAASKPADGSNWMYALHFYAGESGHNAYRTNMSSAISAGIPVFVTEFGTTGADGNTNYNSGNTDTWLNLLNNAKVSWCNWSFSDKAEGSAALVAGSCAAKTFDNMTPSGTYIKGKLATPFAFTDCATNVVPPTVTITSPTKDTTLITGANTTLPLTATVSGGTGTISKVDFLANGKLIGSSTSAPYSFTWTNPPTGVYLVRAEATTSGGIVGLSSTIQVYVDVPEKPYKTTSTGGWPIPGQIEAEDFDIGGNNNAYYDDTPGNSGPGTYRTGEDVDIETPAGASNGFTLGYDNKGEWVKYSVNIAGTGTYKLDLSVASNVTGNSMHVEMDDVNFTQAIAIGSTGGWATFQTVTVNPVTLSEGPHVMKIVFDTDNINIDYVKFTAINTKVTGIFSSDNSYSLETVYPNPSNNAFNFAAKEDIKTLSISNMYGEQIETRQNINSGQTIQVGGSLEAGTYIMNIQNASGKIEMIKLSKVK